MILWNLVSYSSNFIPTLSNNVMFFLIITKVSFWICPSFQRIFVFKSMLTPTKSRYNILPETSLIFIFVVQINCFPYVDDFEGLSSHHPRTHTHTHIFSLSESMQKRSRAWLSSVFHLLIQEITKSSKGKGPSDIGLQRTIHSRSKLFHSYL